MPPHGSVQSVENRYNANYASSPARASFDVACPPSSIRLVSGHQSLKQTPRSAWSAPRIGELHDLSRKTLQQKHLPKSDQLSPQLSSMAGFVHLVSRSPMLVSRLTMIHQQSSCSCRPYLPQANTGLLPQQLPRRAEKERRTKTRSRP